MALHSFNPDVAAKVGLPAAVLYQNIVFWCEKNAANEKHVHDGKVWTYNSVKAFTTLFPYLSAKQIRTALEKLEADGLIESGNFNCSAYDRTKWFCCSGQIDLPIEANEIASEGEPIPDSKPDIKPDNIYMSDFEKDFEDWWKDEYPARKGTQGSKPQSKAIYIRNRKAGVTKEQISKATQEYFDELWEADRVGTEFVKQTTTWLNGKFWEND